MGLPEVPWRRNQCVPDDYGELINRIVRQDFSIKPLLVADMVMWQLGINFKQKLDKFPSFKNITHKVATVKQKIKKGK